MNKTEFLEMMDDQMLRWVADLDELNKRRANIDKAICQLEERIDIARKSIRFLKETHT